MKNEHGELLELLEGISGKGGRTGEIFSEILGLFRQHLEREEETVIPLLGYLRKRLSDSGVVDMEALRYASYAFEEEYSELMEDHADMRKLLGRAIEAISENPDEIASDLARKLLHHLELEENVFYPAVVAASDLLDYEKDYLMIKTGI